VILCRREIREFVNDGYCVNDEFGINYPKGLIWRIHIHHQER